MGCMSEDDIVYWADELLAMGSLTDIGHVSVNWDSI